MEKDDTVYLKHISDAISQIEEYIANMDHEDFIENRLVQDGVIRQIEIIGEATKNLSGNIKEKHPKIPWADIAGMRDKLIHHYFGVNIEAVWSTIEKDMPFLKEQIHKLIANPDKS